MSDDTILRKHCKLYLKVFRAQRAQQIHPFYAHRKANAVASEAHRITPEERRKRDTEWLDKGWEFKGWRKEPPEDKG